MDPTHRFVFACRHIFFKWLRGKFCGGNENISILKGTCKHFLQYANKLNLCTDIRIQPYIWFCLCTVDKALFCIFSLLELLLLYPKTINALQLGYLRFQILTKILSDIKIEMGCRKPFLCTSRTIVNRQCCTFFKYIIYSPDIHFFWYVSNVKKCCISWINWYYNLRICP